MSNAEIKTKKIDPDFPFYNENPKIAAWGILVLAAAVIYMSLSIFLEFDYPWYLGPIVFCAVPLTAYLIVARGKMSLIVKKFKAKDFVRILVTLFLQYAFAFTVGIIRNLVFHVQPTANAVMDADMDLTFWVVILIQLFGEEMFKLLIFLVFLILLYKLTKKRTLSVIVATAVTLLCFALVHATAYDFNWSQILINQGAATFFCMYNDLKSKNILTSYIQHLLLDAIPFVLAMTARGVDTDESREQQRRPVLQPVAYLEQERLGRRHRLGRDHSRLARDEGPYP